jgi:hypothetical protein
MKEPVLSLSVRQPWAWLIVHGFIAGKQTQIPTPLAPDPKLRELQNPAISTPKTPSSMS